MHSTNFNLLAGEDFMVKKKSAKRRMVKKKVSKRNVKKKLKHSRKASKKNKSSKVRKLMRLAKGGKKKKGKKR